MIKVLIKLQGTSVILRVVVDKTDSQRQLAQPFVWCFVGVGMAP